MDPFLDRFKQKLFQWTGMQVRSSQEKPFREKILNRSSQLGVDLEGYWEYLDSTVSEKNRFINLLTVNETSYFRNYGHFKILKKHLIPQLMEKRRAENNLKLEFLSAGCSTGEEVYSLAMILCQTVQFFNAWNCKIHAFDINGDVIEIAREGKYNKMRMAGIPEEFHQYLLIKDNHFEVIPKLKELVSFKRANILEGFSFSSLKVDICFCRNIIIYFDQEKQEEALENLYRAIKPGGYLFLGDSESMVKLKGISSLFEIVEFPEGIVYRRN